MHVTVCVSPSARVLNAVSATPSAVVQKLVSWVGSILSLDLPSQAPPAVNVRLIKAACKTVAVISKLGGSSVAALLVNLE